MTGRPQQTEAPAEYFLYIDKVTGDDVLSAFQSQMETSLALFSGISEEASLHRYVPDKWNIRQLLNHVSDGERIFAYRALWFARGYDSPLPGFDQEIAAANAGADQIPWATHVEEFRRIRLSTISLFRNMPAEAWSRQGIANDKPVTVRALAYVIAGHEAHHISVLRQKYL